MKTVEGNENVCTLNKGIMQVLLKYIFIIILSDCSFYNYIFLNIFYSKTFKYVACIIKYI